VYAVVVVVVCGEEVTVVVNCAVAVVVSTAEVFDQA
jgi:hypothetical protein